MSRKHKQQQVLPTTATKAAGERNAAEGPATSLKPQSVQLFTWVFLSQCLLLCSCSHPEPGGCACCSSAGCEKPEWKAQGSSHAMGHQPDGWGATELKVAIVWKLPSYIQVPSQGTAFTARSSEVRIQPRSSDKIRHSYKMSFQPSLKKRGTSLHTVFPIPASTSG